MTCLHDGRNFMSHHATHHTSVLAMPNSACKVLMRCCTCIGMHGLMPVLAGVRKLESLEHSRRQSVDASVDAPSEKDALQELQVAVTSSSSQGSGLNGTPASPTPGNDNSHLTCGNASSLACLLSACLLWVEENEKQK